MNDKDKIIQGLLRTKIEIIANRNERFAMILDELQELDGSISMKFQKIQSEISEFIQNGNNK